LGDWWRRWLVRDGRLRAPWRLLLFVVAFFAILQLLILLFPFLLALPVAPDRVSAGLIGQSVLLLVAALLAGWIPLRWVDGRRFGDLGFPLHGGVPRELGVGLAIGAAGLAVPVLVLAAVGSYRFVAEGGSPVGWLTVSGLSLAALAVPAAAEEAVFRGYLFRTLVEGVGAPIAILGTSLLFTVVHGANPNVTALGLANIFLAGALLAVAVLRTGSLWFASAVHLGWNWVTAGPLDLPVSGLGGYDVPLYDLDSAGPAWLTGGAFGPEGGLAGTAGAVVALALVIRTTRPGARLAGRLTTGRIEDVEDR
jgi:membrane protease YdiL (CAAX protease family)